MRNRGFTLIEVLLAMFLAGLVLVGLNTFIFSMSELWGRNSDVRLFDQHVRAVTRFLQKEIMITYMELTGNRTLSWPGNPLPEVYCSLQVRRDKGLYMLWHSDLENHFNDDPPRESLVSPFVTAISYDYFDTDFNKWTTETTFRNDAAGNPLAPQRLRVTFTYDKMTREALIMIPKIGQGLPNSW